MEQITFTKLALEVSGDELDFNHARSQADLLVAQHLREPLLIAWYDGIKQEEHPKVPECQHKPGWIAYAEGHGGEVLIDVNQGQFMFIYADLENMR
ncbi:AF1514 family protein [Kaarinaea lacus]